MAYMYPCIREKVSAPTAEQLVYDELKKLPDDYFIFHSVQWVRKNLNRNFTWYENVITLSFINTTVFCCWR